MNNPTDTGPTTARQWREAALVLREHAERFEQAAIAAEVGKAEAVGAAEEARLERERLRRALRECEAYGRELGEEGIGRGQAVVLAARRGLSDE